MFEVGAVHQNKARKLARFGVMIAVLVATCGIGLGLSAVAAPDPCQDVWQGATPSDPLGKVPSVTSAHPGDSVTYTFNWHSTGAANALLEDCYRVDDGAVDSLNAIVSGFYHSVSVPNVGDNGSAQEYQYTIQIPNDNSLIGHSIVNRAKMPQGSTESRTDFVSVAITEAPCTENCGGGTTGDTGGTTGDTGGTTGDTGGTTGDTGGTTTGTTGDTGGTTTGGTTGGTTTGGTTTGGTTTGSDTGNEVLGRTITRKPLATTGSATTALTWIGMAMLMIGVSLRFGRFGTRDAYAMASSSPSTQDLLAQAFLSRSRDWTCKR